MADDETRLLVSLEARLNQFEKSFNRAGSVAERGWQRVEKRTKEAGDRMSAAMGESVEKINRTLELIGVGLGLREVEEMIDSYNRLSARLNIAAGSAEKGAAVMERLDGASKQARVSNDALANSYLQSKDQLDALGYSTETQIEFHQALAEALKLSGASADKAAAIQDALTKALADGTVKGKALNQIFTDGGRVAKVFADYLGVPVSQLSLMADQGKLTSNIMVRALNGSLSQLNGELSKKPMEFSEAVTALKDSLEDYIGKAAKAAGVGDDLGAAVKFVTENFNSLADGAAAAAAVLLSQYLPGLAKIAATTLTNPWLVLAAGAAAAAYAIDEYDGKIKLADGSLVTLKDLAGAAWDEIKAGGEVAAESIKDAYIEAVQFITKALNGVGVSLSDLEQFTIDFAQGVVSSIVFVYDETLAVFKGLPPALAELFIDALNGIRAAFEDLLNFIVDGLNAVISLANVAVDKVGAHIPTFDRIDLGRFQNDYAGAGKALGNALGDGLDDALKPRVRQTLDAMRAAASAAVEDFQKKATQHAQTRQAETHQESPGGGIDSTDHEKQAPNKQWEADIRKFQQNLALMKAETAARAAATGSVEEQDAAIEAFKQQQQLLNEAQAAGVEITDQVKEKIASLADAYREASLQAKEVAKSQQEMRQAAQQFESAEKSAFTGFFDDLAQGKSASDALRSALAGLGKKLMDLGLNMIANDLFKGTGNFLMQPNSGSVGAANIAAGVVNVGGTGSIPGVGSIGSTLPSSSNPLGGIGKLFGLAPAAAPAIAKSVPAATGSLPAPAASQMIGGGASAAFDVAKTQFGKVEGQSDINGFLNSGLKIGGYQNLDAAQTAWCSAFVNSSLNKVGLKGSADLTASSFLKFGKPVRPEDVMKGDVAVVDRGVKPGMPGDHVGFATGQSRIAPNGQQQFQLLAGNSNNRVNYEWRNANQLQFRRPTEALNGDQLGLQQQLEAEKQLQQQTVQTATAVKTLPSSLQGVQVGSQGLDGSLQSMTEVLSQGTPAANSFSSSIQSVLQSLTAKPGVGGGGLGLASLFGFADGGSVSGPGTAKSDSIPAMLSDGEFVVNSNAASKHGQLLAMINSGRVPKFATGGAVSMGFNNSPSNITNITVHAPGAQRGVGSEITTAVNKALDARKPPADSFRRTDMQQMARLGLSSERASRRNG